VNGPFPAEPTAFPPAIRASTRLETDAHLNLDPNHAARIVTGHPSKPTRPVRGSGSSCTVLQDLYTCSGLHLAGSAGLRAARTLRCMKYRPYTRLRTPLIGFKMVKPAHTDQAQGRVRLHRTSLSTSGGRKVAALAPCETVSQPLAIETGRRPEPLRQQSTSGHRHVRRPQDHRVVQNWWPPS
jgi:hypothetical protein